MRKRNRFSSRNIALCGLLTAMMLVLGFIESLLRRFSGNASEDPSSTAIFYSDGQRANGEIVLLE